MGILKWLFGDLTTPGADGVHIIDVPTGSNVRELGSYRVEGGTTIPHRYLRSGSTQYLSRRDIDRLRAYGVTHVLDLRGSAESPDRTCVFAHEPSVTWKNVPLFGYDLSDPKLQVGNDVYNYLLSGYLAMLANHEGVRSCISFCASVPDDSCLLFHCAAGMDRTGMVALLLLGTVGASRDIIIKDYLYSFASISEVNRAVNYGEYADNYRGERLPLRLETIERTYDTLIAAYGTVSDYLLTCGVTGDELAAIRHHLLG